MEISKKAIAIFTEWAALEAETAQEAGAVGFISSAFVQSAFPYRKTEKNERIKKNGNSSLTIMASSEVGIPYGVIPRLLITWISTEAVKTKSPELVLGKSLSEFMSKLDIVPTGGRWGSITRLRDQMKRLSASVITLINDDEKSFRMKHRTIVDSAYICWEPHIINQASLWESTLLLDDQFYADLIAHPVPVDLRAIKLLQSSPMRLDVYTWLTYRMSYVKKPVNIPWEALWLQFGEGYSRLRRFKEIFRSHIQEVLAVYPAAVHETKIGIELRPSPPHIKKIR